MSGEKKRESAACPHSGLELHFALGLLEIGKAWGHRREDPPEEAGALEFLEQAWTAGVRHYDTAASYATSEERFGKFLRGLSPDERRYAFVATKFGEHWDDARGEPYVDHSYDALTASLDRSLERLERIDLLQLHKTTPEVLRSRDLERAWQYASSCGVKQFGASVKDEESAGIAIASGAYAALQLPFNREDRQFEAVVRRAAAAGMHVLANRPLGMGRLLYEGAASRDEALRQAFQFLVGQRFPGMALVGTKSIEHLREDLAAFRSVTAGQAD